MTRTALVQGDSVVEILLRQCERQGARPFFRFEEAEYSYADLEAASRRVAAALQGAGIGRGDRVGILLGNRPEYLFLWFGIARAGAVEVPVNVAHRGDLLAYMLDQSDCRALFVEAELLPAVAAVRAQLPKLEHRIVLDAPAAPLPAGTSRYEDFLAGAGPFAEARLRADDPAAILYTSGTTGPSKGAVLPHAYPPFLGEIVSELAAYGPADRLLNALPLFHGNAQFLSTVPALMSGAQMVLARRFSASGFWDTVRRHGCTEFNYIGGILSILLKADPRPDDAANPLRVMVGGGAPRDRCAEFEERFGVTLLEGYGMSEIGLPLGSSLAQRRAGSCGRPHFGYEVKLVDDDGAEVGAGTPGELLVRPSRMHAMLREYHGMPGATVEAWRDLWFHTGDWLERDADGWYYFVDRKKDAIRRRGENISSFEVERAVLGHPAVLECAAVAVPSELGEDEVLVCVVARPGTTLTPQALIAHCEPRMAKFMLPRYVRILAALPKTPTERVQKYVLRAAGLTADTWDREAPAA